MYSYTERILGFFCAVLGKISYSHFAHLLGTQGVILKSGALRKTPSEGLESWFCMKSWFPCMCCQCRTNPENLLKWTQDNSFVFLWALHHLGALVFKEQIQALDSDAS